MQFGNEYHYDEFGHKVYCDDIRLADGHTVKRSELEANNRRNAEAKRLYYQQCQEESRRLETLKSCVFSLSRHLASTRCKEGICAFYDGECILASDEKRQANNTIGRFCPVIGAGCTERCIMCMKTESGNICKYGR